MVNIHVDVDNLWIYEREYGVSFGVPATLLFEHALPNFLGILERHGARATFFVVGQDLDLDAARRFCRDAIARGHAIANHTYTHPIRWCDLTLTEKREEIQRCHDAIVRVTGQAPIGFRAPGYFLDRATGEILFECGYAYDSSVLPGYASLLMRVYMGLRGAAARSKPFGRPWYLFASRHPRRLVATHGSGSLLELPISVAPLARLPTHSTFLAAWGRTYAAFVMALYRFDRRNHVYLFHAIDLADLPQLTISARYVIPFRRSYAYRRALVVDLVRRLRAINGGSVHTTESQVEHRRTQYIPPMRISS